MIRAALTEQRVYRTWLDYQEALLRAVAPLTPEQLHHRPLPGRRTPGELVEHIVFGRALHLHAALGDSVSVLAPYLSWETPDLSRTAEHLLRGLKLTWQVIAERLHHGSPLDPVTDEAEAGALQTIWGLLDHDLPHAGQLSLILRASGLPGVDI